MTKVGPRSRRTWRSGVGMNPGGLCRRRGRTVERCDGSCLRFGSQSLLPFLQGVSQKWRGTLAEDTFAGVIFWYKIQHNANGIVDKRSRCAPTVEEYLCRSGLQLCTTDTACTGLTPYASRSQSIVGQRPTPRLRRCTTESSTAERRTMLRDQPGLKGFVESMWEELVRYGPHLLRRAEMRGFASMNDA